MVKLIPGKKGSGKTKLLIEAIKTARNESKGNVVAVQIGSSLNSSVHYSVRLINVEDYKIGNYKNQNNEIEGYDAMFGFIGGILASDYDCTHIFVDGILRIAGRDLSKIGEMLGKIEKVSGETVVTLTISADADGLPPEVKKYC
ncbi:MAG: hypothetical protein LBI38_01570 [Oscillospiraceae bacterium]|jgi:hypothetical protein|nr:hypothetical protein [Oscillospiraceae bacterium]